MKFWAIKRPSDGAFLPQVGGRTRGGYTYTEPFNGGVPRLFVSERAAKTALTHWLRGHYSVHVTSHPGFDDDCVDVEHKVTKVEGRAEQSLVVVCMDLKEVSE